MSPAAKAREAVNGRTTTSARTSSRARLIDRRGGPRYGPPASSSEGGYAPLGLPRPSLGRAPAQPWRASGLTQDVSSLPPREGRRAPRPVPRDGLAHAILQRDLRRKPRERPQAREIGTAARHRPSGRGPAQQAGTEIGGAQDEGGEVHDPRLLRVVADVDPGTPR